MNVLLTQLLYIGNYELKLGESGLFVKGAINIV